MPMFELELPADEEEITLSRFASSVFRSWCGFMTGGTVGIAFLIWTLFDTLPAILFSLVSGVAIFVACYVLWREERLKRFSVERDLLNQKQKLVSNQTVIDKLTRELTEEIEQRVPQLNGVIEEIYTAEVFEGNVKKTAITVKISLRNSGGSPSAAVNWTPYILVNGNKPRQCHILHFSNELKLGFFDKVEPIVIKSTDMIYEKTVEPIQPGSIIFGYIHFRTSFQINQVRADDTVIKILFNDVKEKQCEIIFDKEHSFSYPAPRYTPGLQTKSIKVSKAKKNFRKKRK